MKRLLLAVVLVLAGVTAPVAAGEMYTIDADHGLTDRETIKTFEETGVASTQLTAPNMSLTVAESHDDVGLEGVRLDFDKVYFRIQYNETVDRTLRIYIPSEYWYPLTSLEHQAENADITADFQPTETGRYTAVTIHLTEPTDAVFAISKATSGFWFVKGQGRGVINNTTGYQPPRIGSTGKWKYVPNESLAGNATYPIDAKQGATIQYDADPSPAETWLTVPNCGGSDAPVCVYEKQGVKNTVYVLSKTDDAPPVRWKTGNDVGAKAGSAWEDVKLIPDRVWESLSNLFGNGGDSK